MRRVVVLVLLAVVVVAVVVAVSAYLVEERGETTLTLAEVVGEVTVTGADQASEGGRAGRALAPLDRVATATGARAVLVVGGETRIRLGPASTIQVKGVDAHGVAIELEEGALQATVRPEAGAVRLSSRGRQALLTAGEVAMGVGPDGLMLFEVTRGDVMLGGIVGASVLGEGERIVVGNGDHVEIGRIPPELLLSVQWPEEGRTRGDVVILPGRTEPGALVRVEGSGGVREVRAGPQGEFRVELPLFEGPNAVRVEAVDLLGQTIEQRGLLERDRRGPTFRGGVEYGP